MSVLNSSDMMMSVASTEAQIAGLVLQPAIMIGFQFKLSTGKAANVDKAGQQWRDAAGQVEQVIDDLREAIAGVAAQDWTADDRTAHEGKVQEACSQLETVHIFLMAVGVALTVFGYALFAYAIFAAGMGTFLDVLAELAVDALAGIVTAELYAEFEEIAAACLTITSVATAILAGAASIVAAVMQGGAALDAAIETYQGDDRALGDLKQAEEVGSAAALANLAQNGINAGLAYANRTKGINVPGGSGKKSPISAVDLDADRDKDHTWNVGGSATFTGKNDTEYTGGAHVKYGDRGWQGVEVEGRRKDSSGDFNGGKAGWNEDSHGDDHIYAGTSDGEAPQTGSGYKVETNLDYNIDKQRVDSGSVSAGETNRGGDVVKGSEGFTRDDNGNVQWNKPGVDTPRGDLRNGRYFA